MKNILIICIYLTLIITGDFSFSRTEESLATEAKQVLLWKENLVSAQKLTDKEKIEKLALGLRNMGYRRKLEGHSSSVDLIYNDLQRELLSIPMHAQYFADKIIAEQKAVASYPTNVGPRGNYDFNRTLIFEILSCLPSPETVRVLGEFLADDIDTPVPLRSPDSDWGDNSRANSYGSAYTLMRSGLRNPPVAEDRRNDNPDEILADTRAWWEEVKSGKRSFSFVGQKSEYRFKPDGTWETIPISLPPGEVVPKAPISVTPESVLVSPKSQDRSWLWITSLSVLLVAVVGWLVRKKKRA